MKKTWVSLCEVNHKIIKKKIYSENLQNIQCHGEKHNMWDIGIDSR